MTASAGAEAQAWRRGDHLIGRIPVRNLWLLMLYASDLVRYRGYGKVAIEQNPDDIPDLIAEILCRAVERRLKRNLTYGYRPVTCVLNRVRGRVDLLTTERQSLRSRGLVACRFQDLTVNTARNRLVRAALESMAQALGDKNKQLRHRCRVVANTLRAMGVAGDRPSRIEIGTDRVSRNEASDQFMVSAAMLALNLSLPTEVGGGHFFTLADREASWVRHLYERAIGGFYDVVLSPLGWRVETGTLLRWLVEGETPGVSSILPSMKTDIVLDHHGDSRRIIIDTKFNAILTSGWYREETLRSAYLYQIYAYIRSQEDDDDLASKLAEGLLLHPSVGETIDETVVIQSHAIRFATVDLTAEAQEIRKRLIDVIRKPMVASGMARTQSVF